MTTKTVTIFDKEYVYDTLSNDLKTMVNLFYKWKKESEEHKLQFLKTEGACRDLAREISEMIETQKESTPYTATLNNKGHEVIEFKNK